MGRWMAVSSVGLRGSWVCLWARWALMIGDGDAGGAVRIFQVGWLRAGSNVAWGCREIGVGETI